MADKITKANLVDNIHEKIKLDQKDISCVIDLLFDEIKTSLKKGNPIELRGFGTFNLKYSNRKEAKNPKTGEKVAVTPHYKVNFIPGKDLKDGIEINDDKE